jgi:integrase
VPVANLTKRYVDSLQFTKKADYLVWDQKLRGFGIRVREYAAKDGTIQKRKTFVVGYRPKGSRQYRRFVIGMYGPMTVEQARIEALRHLSAVSQGDDPLEAKRAERAAQTVREFGEQFLSYVDDRRKQTTAREYRRLWIRHVLPALGSKKVAEVSTSDILRLHRSLRETPYAANRVVALLGVFFSFAGREGVRPGHDNPTRTTELYPEAPRERFLTADEFRQLGEALTRAESVGLPAAPGYRRLPKSPETAKHRTEKADVPVKANPFSIAAIRLLILTGCREGEILSLRWDAVDFERGYLRLADTKTGRSVRPLSLSAAELLGTLPRLDRNPFVLPGAKPGQHLQEIKRVWYAVRHAAGLGEVRLHDLRHSFASVPASSGESLLIVRTLLGHRRASTTERYAHLGDDPVKRAADRTAKSIAGWLAGRVSPTAAALQPTAQE